MTVNLPYCDYHAYVGTSRVRTASSLYYFGTMRTSDWLPVGRPGEAAEPVRRSALSDSGTDYSDDASSRSETDDDSDRDYDSDDPDMDLFADDRDSDDEEHPFSMGVDHTFSLSMDPFDDDRDSEDDAFMSIGEADPDAVQPMERLFAEA